MPRVGRVKRRANPHDLIFTDRTAAACTSERHGLRSLATAIRSGRVDVLIMVSLDRLCRIERTSFAYIQDEIIGQGVRCELIDC